MNNDMGLCPETGGRLNERTTKAQVAAGISVLLLLVVAVLGMTGTSAAPAISESPSLPTIPVLTPISILDLTPTRPPENGFEYALEQSRWEKDDWEIVRLIIQCESGGDRWAVGAAGEIGLLQIHPIHGFTSDLFDPLSNLNAGFEVYEEQGFGAWTCFGGVQ